MPVFKIVSSRRGASQNSAVFGIKLVSGELVADETFRCYDTHHPIDYRIIEVQKNAEGATLVCDGF